MKFLSPILAFIRSLGVAFFFPLTMIILGPISLLLHYLLHSRKLDNFFITLWGQLCCQMAGVQVVVEGRENIPKEGCLFLFNHTSFFDVFALTGYIDSVRFGAKAELFKIPIFGQAMKAVGTLPISRNNRDEVYKIYDEAKLRFAKGEQFALSAEGGRFYGPELSPFKAGPFIFAMSAGAPIVPIVILGAYTALPKGSFLFNKKKLHHTIFLKIMEPIPTKTLAAEERKDLQQIVYDKMNSVWVEEKGFKV